MASTPWRKSGASTLFSPASDSPSKKVPLKKGLFADGMWQCKHLFPSLPPFLYPDTNSCEWMNRQLHPPPPRLPFPSQERRTK